MRFSFTCSILTSTKLCRYNPKTLTLGCGESSFIWSSSHVSKNNQFTFLTTLVPSAFLKAWPDCLVLYKRVADLTVCSALVLRIN